MRLASSPVVERASALALELAEHVHTWWQCLDVDDNSFARLTALLSPDELRHAQRFRFAIDARRYAVRRAVLRDLLARHIGCSPRDFGIRQNTFGKPCIEGADVTFSLSHSQDMALYAFSRGLRIGCDVEWQNSSIPIRETVEIFLSSDEIESVYLLPERQHTQALFHYWTGKEAYLKARGIGFSVPPQDITISLGAMPHFVALPDDDPWDWSLAYFYPADGYVAALAINGPSLSSAEDVKPISKPSVLLGWGTHAYVGVEASRTILKHI